MNIIVDAMGGDNAPSAIVNGCIDAVLEKQGFDITLVGNTDKINSILKSRNYSDKRIIVHEASEIITNDDSPTKAIRSKKNSSMVVAYNMLKEKKGNAMISAGNSGALMAGALFILGRIKGVDRPSLPALIPTKKGVSLIIDAGLNTVCKPINLMQFGIMGSLYMKELFQIDKPKVGLINVGAEEGKGNDVLKQAYNLMTEHEMNFIGNIEGKDITEGKIDVIVCDGFVGNVMLKFYEGMGSFFFGVLKKIFTQNLLTKMAALVIKGKLKEFMKSVDPDENGGAPILGVNGLVIKSHGSSKAKTIKNVIIKRAFTLANTSILDQIEQEFNNFEVEVSQNDD